MHGIIGYKWKANTPTVWGSNIRNTPKHIGLLNKFHLFKFICIKEMKIEICYLVPGRVNK